MDKYYEKDLKEYIKINKLGLLNKKEKEEVKKSIFFAMFRFQKNWQRLKAEIKEEFEI